VDFHSGIKDRYRPQRQYKAHTQKRRHWTTSVPSSRIEKTLLEYGQRYAVTASQESSKGKEGEQDKASEEEKKRIDALVDQMKKVDIDPRRASSSVVGSFVGMESDAIKQVAFSIFSFFLSFFSSYHLLFFFDQL